MENNESIILFQNTTAEKVTGSTGRFLGWYVSADAGYVMHEITHDEKALDEEGNPTNENVLGYTRAPVFVQYNYDFENNPREIYAQLESEIPDPAKQIHGDESAASTEPGTAPETITE